MNLIFGRTEESPAKIGCRANLGSSSCRDEMFSEFPPCSALCNSKFSADEAQRVCDDLFFYRTMPETLDGGGGGGIGAAGVGGSGTTSSPSAEEKPGPDAGGGWPEAKRSLPPNARMTSSSSREFDDSSINEPAAVDPAGPVTRGEASPDGASQPKGDGEATLFHLFRTRCACDVSRLLVRRAGCRWLASHRVLDSIRLTCPNNSSRTRLVLHPPRRPARFLPWLRRHRRHCMLFDGDDACGTVRSLLPLSLDKRRPVCSSAAVRGSSPW